MSPLPAAAIAQQPQLSQSAIQQIQALVNDKNFRTPAQRKIHSWLLLGIKKRRGDAVTNVEVNRDGMILVDITATVSDALLREINALGGQSGNPGTSEGTAMLEIVFDLAPGAGLRFATANGGQA